MAEQKQPIEFLSASAQPVPAPDGPALALLKEAPLLNDVLARPSMYQEWYTKVQAVLRG